MLLQHFHIDQNQTRLTTFYRVITPNNYWVLGCIWSEQLSQLSNEMLPLYQTYKSAEPAKESLGVNRLRDR